LPSIALDGFKAGIRGLDFNEEVERWKKNLFKMGDIQKTKRIKIIEYFGS